MHNAASYNSINVKNTLIQLHNESYSEKIYITYCETTGILKLAFRRCSDSSFFDSEVNVTFGSQGNSNTKLQGNLEKYNTHIVAI